jgi:hypothetical protein
VTGPHDPDAPWYGTGGDEPGEHAEESGAAPAWEGEEARAAAGPTDPPTEPAPTRPGTSYPGPSGSRPPEPPRPDSPTARSTRVEPGTRPRWWRSPRARAGAAATLAGLVLLGGGFGAGYAVADASAPSTAAHVTAPGAAGTGTAARQAARKRRLAEQRRERQDGGAAPGAGTTPAGTTPGATTPTF